MQLYRIFNSTISATLHLVNFDVVDYKMRIEKASGVFRYVSHIIKGVCAFVPQPFINLIAPKGFFALRHKKITQFFT